MKDTILTRFVVLDDERGLLLGTDKDNIFKKGVVYTVRKLVGEYVVTPIGKYSLRGLAPGDSWPSLADHAGAIIEDGRHLITEEEKYVSHPISTI